MRLTRRSFLKGMGVTVGGVGLAATGYEKLIPYIHQPDDFVPGVSTWYATSCRECPAGCGMVLRNRESRVVKCEGNPQHPVNRGTLCARGQAAVQGLYDPDRVAGPMRQTKTREFEPVKWEASLAAVGEKLKTSRSVAIISDLQTGSLAGLMNSWLSSFVAHRLVMYEPINYENIKSAYGVVPSFDIAGCDCLVSLGADFLETWISPVEYARQFAEMRQVKNGSRAPFIYIGSRVSMTAANADVRMIVTPKAQGEVVGAIAHILGREPGDGLTDRIAKKYGLDYSELASISASLFGAKRPVVLPGGTLDATFAAFGLNRVLKSPLVDRNRPHAVTNIASRAEMESIIVAMERGEIDSLVVYGANPAFSLPEARRFAEAVKRVPLVVSLSSYMDETTALAHWILPSNTPLESWGDYSPYPDVTNLMQPAMGTLFDTKHTGDILIGMARAAGIAKLSKNSYYEYLRERWGCPISSPEKAASWESALQVGGSWPVTGGDATPITGYGSPGWRVATGATVTLPKAPTAPKLAQPPADSPSLREGELTLWAYPHPHIYDGRGANKSWLQETPEPVTNCVWGTWAELHPSTAKKLGVDTDGEILVRSRGAQIRLPVFVWEGVAPDTVAVPMGQGHTHYGQFAAGIGVNVFPLTKFEATPVQVVVTGEETWTPRIKGSSDQEGREIVQTTELAKPFKRETPIRMPLPEGYGWDDFYEGHEHAAHRWAMVVDLDRCIGCHACVTACYAENNLQVVGSDGVWRRREMSWVRIDRYFEWEQKSAPVLFQPMMCQQCDQAPCEPVCPVFAAAHSDEGLNMQVYNRCIGTRYCSNNCPYKVRRFNFYGPKWPKPLDYQLNPDVTVRSRGVMEKCTFCVQRIREAAIIAKREGRTLKDGEITPACAQTCPTGAFTFGDLKDPDARVTQIIRKDPRAYQVLAELNTKPAVIYLKKIVG